MIIYSKKIQAAIKDMKLNPTIAKAPTSKSSLSIPSGITGTVTNGSLKVNEVAYRISAINDYGETAASEEFVIQIGTMLDTVNIIDSEYTPGILTKGVYYYGITATNESGETNIINTFYVNNPGSPAPTWANNPAIVTNDGMLPAGTYFYSIVSVIDGKETDLSTFQEVQVSQENSSINLSFLAVEGATSYNIYGRDRSMPKRIGTVNAGVYTGADQVIEFKDNGTAIGRESAPTFNNTTAGIELKWDKIQGNVKSYKIYGRTSPIVSELRFIAEVSADKTSYKDQGYITPTFTAPIRNTTGYSTGAGVVLKWNPVPSATGYRIYGREKSYEIIEGIIKEEKGYLTTIQDPSVTIWTDNGLVSPDMTNPYPTSDTTDGTRGVLGSIIPDGETLEITENGVLSVKGGIDSFLGNSLISAVKDQDVLIYDEVAQKWVNYDLTSLIFTLISISDNTIVPKSKEFEEYKSTLINSLNILNTFKDRFIALENKIKYLEKCIISNDRDIGTSFYPEMQIVEDENNSIEEDKETNLVVSPLSVQIPIGEKKILNIETEALDFDMLSKNEGVVTVNKVNKELTGVSEGNTKVEISATEEGKEPKTISVDVEVTKKPTLLTVSPQIKTLEKGKQQVLEIGTDADDFTIESSITDYATVDKESKTISGIAVGKTFITIKATAVDKLETIVKWELEIIESIEDELE